MSYSKVFYVYLLLFATTCSPALKQGAYPGLTVEETAKSFITVHSSCNYEKSTFGIRSSWALLSNDFKKELGSIENFELLMHTKDHLPILQMRHTQVLNTHQYHSNRADVFMLVYHNKETTQYVLELRRNNHNAWQIHAVNSVSKKKDYLISI